MPAPPPRGAAPWVSQWQREWLSASLGCAVADTLFNPLEVLKVRRQVAMGGAANGTSTVPSSTFALARTAITEKGVWRGLWHPGLEATVYRAFSYTGFRIGLYPSVRDAISASKLFGDGDTISAKVLAGAATGAVGSAVFNPIDVVRIRMQGGSPYTSTLGAFRDIVKKEGIAGLWRGYGVCMLRAAKRRAAGDVRHGEAKAETFSRFAVQRGPFFTFHRIPRIRHRGADGDAAGGYPENAGHGELVEVARFGKRFNASKRNRRRDSVASTKRTQSVVPRVLARRGTARPGDGHPNAIGGTVQESDGVGVLLGWLGIIFRQGRFSTPSRYGELVFIPVVVPVVVPVVLLLVSLPLPLPLHVYYYWSLSSTYPNPTSWSL